MKSGDLVKEKVTQRCEGDSDHPRIGVIVRDDMSGLITVLWLSLIHISEPTRRS